MTICTYITSDTKLKGAITAGERERPMMKGKVIQPPCLLLESDDDTIWYSSVWEREPFSILEQRSNLAMDQIYRNSKFARLN